MNAWGSDPDALERLGVQFKACAADLATMRQSIGASLQHTAWLGPGADRFRGDWAARHARALQGAHDFLFQSASVLHRQAGEQRTASAATGGGSGHGPGSHSTSPLDPHHKIDWFHFLWDMHGVYGNVMNVFKLGELMTAREVSFGFYLMAQEGRIPFTFVGGGLLQHTAEFLDHIPLISKLDLADNLAAFVSSPVGQQFFRGLGIAGAAIGTGMGVYSLVKDGNPVTAFRKDPSGYSATVAGTAFNASTMALLYAPSPVTLGLTLGTGLVYAGTEVWHHWGDITSAASSAEHWVGHRVTDVEHLAGDAASGVAHLAESGAHEVGHVLTSPIRALGSLF